MAKPEWGVKRACASCGARFYDLGRDPAICPECGATFDLEALARVRRTRPVERAAMAAAAVVDADLVDVDEEDALIDADEDDEALPPEEDEEAAVIETVPAEPDDDLGPEDDVLLEDDDDETPVDDLDAFGEEPDVEEEDGRR